MSYVNICNLLVNQNPCSFLAPFSFSVTFECLQPIREEIEWKVIYVGCPKDDKYDQELDSFTIGPFDQSGIMQFDIEPPAPDVSKIPADDLLGVAAIIHSVSYQKQEFFRVGYFVYNNYEDPFLLENPYPVQIDKIVRSILADKPRIIRHNIDWESDRTEKLKALNNMFGGEQSNMVADTNIQFKGMFSDLGGQATSVGDFNGFNWGNNNSNNGGYFNNNGQGNNGFGFDQNQNKENYNNGNHMGQQMNGGMDKGMFGGNGDFNNYNQNGFMQNNNGNMFGNQQQQGHNLFTGMGGQNNQQQYANNLFGGHPNTF